jgi:hypothetical protein
MPDLCRANHAAAQARTDKQKVARGVRGLLMAAGEVFQLLYIAAVLFGLRD